MHSGDRVQGSQEHTACQIVGLATDVHAEVHPIDGIYISVPGRAKQHEITWRRAAMCMRSRVRLIVVRTQISLDLDNSSRQHAIPVFAHEQLSQKVRRHFFWRILKKRSRKEA